MALEDMNTGRKWNGNMYHILRRYLDVSVGKKWADIYAKLCAVADANTYLGHELRHAIIREVDEHFSENKYHYGDWYVNNHGELQAYPKTSWKTLFKERKAKAPIERIQFKDDGIDVWYELVDVPDGPRASKYTKMDKAWFRTVRTVEYNTHPLEDTTAVRKRVGNDPSIKKGKQGWYKEYTTERFNSTQVGGSLLADLRAISMHKSLTGKRRYKIIRLSYGSLHDNKGLTAFVTGKSINK